jgi:1-acyl-sn-glycerol-3-phosphate acyltransferase
MSLVVWLTVALLFLPWVLLPGPAQRPEIHGGLRLLWWLNALYCAIMHRLDSGGPAPLPAHGPAILISNHTCSIDNLILQAGCRRVLGFLIAQEFYDFWLFHPLCVLLGCIPVKRDGHDLAATRAALRALAQGRVLPIFPEGRILPMSGQEIAEGKSGAAFIALHAQVPVIPAYIRGTPRTNNVFKALVTPSRSKVIYGQPIDLSEELTAEPIDKAIVASVTRKLMAAIEALRARSLAADEAPPAWAHPGAAPDDRRPDRPLGALSGDSPALVGT